MREHAGAMIPFLDEDNDKVERIGKPEPMGKMREHAAATIPFFDEDFAPQKSGHVQIPFRMDDQEMQQIQQQEDPQLIINCRKQQ